MPAGSYTKVVNIWMENKDANSIIGSNSAPFANQMANTYGSATNFRTIVHPSLPNYVAATSGGTQGITDDAAPSSHPLRAQSIFGELDAAGKSWKAYQEGMTSNCMTSNTGRYAVKHNPGRITCRCGHRAKSTTCPWAPRPVAISSTTSTTAPCRIAHSSRPTCATRRMTAQ
jgi:hypothetical protein